MSCLIFFCIYVTRILFLGLRICICTILINIHRAWTICSLICFISLGKFLAFFLQTLVFIGSHTLSLFGTPSFILILITLTSISFRPFFCISCSSFLLLQFGYFLLACHPDYCSISLPLIYLPVGFTYYIVQY